MKYPLLISLLLLAACESYQVTETINSSVQITNVQQGAKGAIQLVIQQPDHPQTYDVTVYHCSHDVNFKVGDKIKYPLTHRVYDTEHSYKDGYYYESTYCEYITWFQWDN
jgi:hypothetical protein